MMNASEFRTPYPTYFCRVDDLNMGIVALAVVMSEFHYGVLVWMDGTGDIECSDTETVRSVIVGTLCDLMPDIVAQYQEAFRGEIASFPALPKKVTYDFEIFFPGVLDFPLPDEEEEGSGGLWYIFIAPEEVSFDDFFVTAHHLNN